MLSMQVLITAPCSRAQDAEHASAHHGALLPFPQVRAAACELSSQFFARQMSRQFSLGSGPLAADGSGGFGAGVGAGLGTGFGVGASDFFQQALASAVYAKAGQFNGAAPSLSRQASMSSPSACNVSPELTRVLTAESGGGGSGAGSGGGSGSLSRKNTFEGSVRGSGLVRMASTDALGGRGSPVSSPRERDEQRRSFPLDP